RSSTGLLAASSPTGSEGSREARSRAWETDLTHGPPRGAFSLAHLMHHGRRRELPDRQRVASYRQWTGVLRIRGYALDVYPVRGVLDAFAAGRHVRAPGFWDMLRRRMFSSHLP